MHIGHLRLGHSLTLTARHNLCVGGDLVSHPSWTISFEWRLDITHSPIGLRMPELEAERPNCRLICVSSWCAAPPKWVNRHHYKWLENMASDWPICAILTPTFALVETGYFCTITLRFCNYRYFNTIFNRTYGSALIFEFVMIRKKCMTFCDLWPHARESSSVLVNHSRWWQNQDLVVAKASELAWYAS